MNRMLLVCASSLVALASHAQAVSSSAVSFSIDTTEGGAERRLDFGAMPVVYSADSRTDGATGAAVLTFESPSGFVTNIVCQNRSAELFAPCEAGGWTIWHAHGSVLDSRKVRVVVPMLTIDASSPGRVLPNTSQSVIYWVLPRHAFRSVMFEPGYDIREFVEYVEVMITTGGSEQWDCFKDPRDRSKTDDYDFSRVVEGCRGIVAAGFKPYLKLGTVPLKLSSGKPSAVYEVSRLPPDDFEEYGRYMEACAKALVDAFGRDEVLKWRFAVFTEFENAEWLWAGSGGKSRHAYCRIYEVTANAFARVVSPDIDIGAHAMVVTEGEWDERDFIKYAAQKKLPLKFLTASFYESCPGGRPRGKTLSQTLSHLREAAKAVGFKNLRYGIDEGRILNGDKMANGKRRPLQMRVVGDTWQAAYDARVVKTLFDEGADWFAAWGYFSGPNVMMRGLPTVSFHVARESAKFKGMRRLPVEKRGSPRPGLEIDAVSALSSDGATLRIMAYAFENDLHATGRAQFNLRVVIPKMWRGGGSFKVARRLVDDDANWFDEWRAERRKRGWGDECYSWSADSPSPLEMQGLKNPEYKRIFVEEIAPTLRQFARLDATESTTSPESDGALSFPCNIPVNSVLFMEITQNKGDKR